MAKESDNNIEREAGLPNPQVRPNAVERAADSLGYLIMYGRAQRNYRGVSPAELSERPGNLAERRRRDRLSPETVQVVLRSFSGPETESQ